MTDARKKYMREYLKAYYLKHREKMKGKSRAYFAANKERVLAEQKERYEKNRRAILDRQKAYYRKNKVRRAAYHAKWRAINADKVKADKKAYYEATKADRLAYLKKYKRDTPGYTRAYTARRRARLKRAAIGKVTAADIRALYATHRTCAYCGKLLNKKTRTLDHITPLCMGGAHCLANLIPACKTCNGKKGARIVAKKTAVSQSGSSR